MLHNTKVESRIKERSDIILYWHEAKSYYETQAIRKVNRCIVAKIE
jgi:hypothetical protein